MCCCFVFQVFYFALLCFPSFRFICWIAWDRISTMLYICLWAWALYMHIIRFFFHTHNVDEMFSVHCSFGVGNKIHAHTSQHRGRRSTSQAAVEQSCRQLDTKGREKKRLVKVLYESWYCGKFVIWHPQKWSKEIYTILSSIERIVM